jgi:predicted acyl esterase
VRIGRTSAAVLLAISVVAAGCSSSGSGGGGGADASTTLVAHGGTEQIWMRTDPKVEVAVYDRHGEIVPTATIDAIGKVGTTKTRTTDANGAVVFRYVPVGKGYEVRRTDGSARSKPVDVTSLGFKPDQSMYSGQKLQDGYGYLTTRDGTKLAINVTLPGPADKGPYPTVVEYSGYDPANPEPSLVTISKTLAAGQGFATVGVNIRGSGCSGGSFQLWEDAQAADGYDAIETVAAQPWVKDHTVGMVGISYPASAMLYTAATQPPHLSAIAPMAAYDDGFRALMWPGGIQNTGFARAWVQERDDEARPLNSDWTKKRVKEGDKTCKDNMALRGQNVAFGPLIDKTPYYPTNHGLGDSFAPATFVDRIKVPTLLVAAWQDEQVGGHAPTMIPQLKHVPHLYATLTNGYHTEGLANPSVLQRWMEFLQLYVAKEVPDTKGILGISPSVTGEIIGDGDAAGKMPTLPEHYAAGTTYAQALADYEKQPKVRVLFDEGGADSVDPGVPVHAFEHGFDAYPVDDATATSWYLGPNGSLGSAAPTTADDAKGTVDLYTSDPKARPPIDLVAGQDSWARLPEYDWQEPPKGSALSYISPALAKDTVMVGTGSADLYVRSSEKDTDLQVTLTEVRPDGKETYVQSGWLRATKRKVDDKTSTDLQPVQTQLEDDAADLPAGEFTKVRVEIYPFGHAFRKGSRIRVIISAPGGDKPVWSFVTLPGTQKDEIAHSEGRPSSIVLPVIPDIAVPTPLPPCPGLRGQPCRVYQPAS